MCNREEPLLPQQTVCDRTGGRSPASRFATAGPSLGECDAALAWVEQLVIVPLHTLQAAASGLRTCAWLIDALRAHGCKVLYFPSFTKAPLWLLLTSHKSSGCPMKGQKLKGIFHFMNEARSYGSYDSLVWYW